MSKFLCKKNQLFHESEVHLGMCNLPALVRNRGQMEVSVERCKISTLCLWITTCLSVRLEQEVDSVTIILFAWNTRYDMARAVCLKQSLPIASLTDVSVFEKHCEGILGLDPKAGSLLMWRGRAKNKLIVGGKGRSVLMKTIKHWMLCGKNSHQESWS